MLAIGWSQNWWGMELRSDAAPWLSWLTLAGGLTILLLSVCHLSAVARRRLDLGIALGAALVVGTYLATIAPTLPPQTDEIATGQESATLVLHGQNPYGRNLGPAEQAAGLPLIYHTATVSGGLISKISYPALSFLLYVPFGALMGTSSQYAVVVDIFAWLAAMLILWRLLRPSLRPVVPLLMGSALYDTMVQGGVTDFLYLPFLLVAWWAWDRYGEAGERSWARWIGPIALGLACSVKQTPWFMAPYLLVGVTLEARSRSDRWVRVGMGYAAMAGGTFLAVNLPFIIAGPRAWIDGVLSPMMDPLVPYGQGLMQLVVNAHIGGGRISLLTVASLLTVMALLAGAIATYPRSKRVLPVLAVVPLAVATRALPNYFAFVPTILLVAATSVRAGERGKGPVPEGARQVARAVSGIAATAAVVALIGFITGSAPMRLTVIGESSTGTGMSRTSEVALTARNLTDRTLRPHFFLTNGPLDVPEWSVVSGPSELKPDAVATYVLRSSEAQVTLPTGVFEVLAFTASPVTVSASETFVAQ